eukprot:gene11871-2421_t
MGCFAFMRIGLENSPYSDLLDPVNWLEINDILARDACTLLGLSISSPLEVSVTTGCIALPTLLQIKQVMRQRQCTGVWSSKEELPVEIELENDYRFHSIFACPILRQQCGRTNPPMRLVEVSLLPNGDGPKTGTTDQVLIGQDVLWLEWVKVVQILRTRSVGVVLRRS